MSMRQRNVSKREKTRSNSDLKFDRSHRLAQLRKRNRNLWDDDDEDDQDDQDEEDDQEDQDEDVEDEQIETVDDDQDDDDENARWIEKQRRKIRSSLKRTISVVFSESDEEIQIPNDFRSKEKNFVQKQNDSKISPSKRKVSTCLICSILSKLTKTNCCVEHLSTLKSSKRKTDLKNHVMILPVNDEMVQRYVSPADLQRSRKSVPVSKESQTNFDERNLEIRQTTPKSSPSKTLEKTNVQSESSIVVEPSDGVLTIELSDGESFDSNDEKFQSTRENRFSNVAEEKPNLDETLNLPEIPLKSARFRRTNESNKIQENFSTNEKSTRTESNEENPEMVISFRHNPDGSRLAVSRSSLRQNSTDVTTK